MQDKPLGLTRVLARFVVETDTGDIPANIFEYAKIALMDWISVTLAGKDDPLVAKLIRYSDLMGGHEQATILGHGMKKSASHAALINGAASHALDYDDTLEIFVGHPSATLFPSILALSEWKQMSGNDLLTAYIIGIQVGATIGACGGAEHYTSGWHATSTLGHFASAAGCAKLMGLDEQQTVYALGIAGTQASGLRSAFGTMCKPFHAGMSSQAGLVAALLAGEGFTSAEDILEGRDGFLQVLNGKLNKDAASALGKKWETENIIQKYHASCHATHSPIEGALSVVKEEGLNPGDIKSIKILASQMALDVAAKTNIKTGLEGKFSISYCVANALLRGNTGMQAFTDEKANDPDVQEYMKKISVVCFPDFKMVEAKIEVETNLGQVYTRMVNIMKDVPTIETRKAKIKNKLIDLCSPILGDKKSEELSEAIISLEKTANMRTFVNQISS